MRWGRDRAQRCIIKPVTLRTMELNLTWGLWKWCSIYTSKLPHWRVKEWGYLHSCGSLVEGCCRGVNYPVLLACFTWWPRQSSGRKFRCWQLACLEMVRPGDFKPGTHRDLLWSRHLPSAISFNLCIYPRLNLLFSVLLPRTGTRVRVRPSCQAQHLRGHQKTWPSNNILTQYLKKKE